MKKHLVIFVGAAALLGLLAISSLKSAPPEAARMPNRSGPAMDNAIIEQGPHHRVWARVSAETNAAGQVDYRTNSYTELATGLNYLEEGQWVETSEQIEPHPQGAVAQRGPHRVTFANNLNSLGSIELSTPDNKRLRSHIVGLSYFDYATGQSVLIAEVQNCEGKVSGNAVIYEDAFTDFKADVRYTYTRAGLEQDVILREQPPAPEEYGLNAATTVLQVLTEFLAPPAPAITHNGAQAAETDESLEFGAMTIGPGKAFSLGGGADSAAVPVRKQWMRLEGRDFLVEEVQVPTVKTHLKALPKHEGASVNPETNSVRHVVSSRRLLPAARLAQAGGKNMKFAKLTTPEKAFVLDYVTLASSGTNYVLKGDTTYYLSGTVNMVGTTTFEAGTVLKYAVGASMQVMSVNWLGTPYRPVVMTAKDDNSVGENISGSTGNPTTNYYANPALNFSSIPPTNWSVSNFRISFASQAIYASCVSFSLYLNHGQIVNCPSALQIPGQGTAFLKNLLISKFQNAFTLNIGGVQAQNVTFDAIPIGPPNFTPSFLISSGSSQSGSANLVNCILANISVFSPVNPNLVTGDHNGFYNNGNSPFGTATITTTSNPFRSVGAGNYYLTNTSAFVDAGTNSIDQNLLADLRVKTVFPPTVVTNFTVIMQTNWNRTVARDTNSVDLGFHYDALDYLCSQIILGGPTLTLNPGVAVGLFGAVGFSTTNGIAGLTSDGRADTMNRIAWYPSVQEQSIKLNNIGTFYSSIVDVYTSSPYGSSPKVLSFYYTDFPMLGGRQRLLLQAIPLYWSILSAHDCWFRGIDLSIAPFYGGPPFYVVAQMNLQNNLFERCSLGVFNGYIHYYYGENQYVIVQNPTSASLYNNLFWQSSVSLTHMDNEASNHIAWAVKDNLFDQCSSISFSGDGNYLALVGRLDNAFYLSPTYTNLLGSGNVLLTNLTYAIGRFGPWYIGSASPSLVDKGSRSGGAAGLYHHTISTNQIKEATSTVDIGFHYVAVNGSGNPIDTDGDGVPDYVEDKNGNGSYESGSETPWQCLNAPSGLVAWWPGEGTAADSAGWSPGVLLNGVGFTAGKVGQAFNLDGIDDRITADGASQLNIGAGVDFSLEAWIRPLTNATTYGVVTVLSKRYAQVFTRGYELYLQDGKLAIQLADSAGVQNFGATGPDLRDNVFHHVVASVDRDSATGGKLYIDGQLIYTFNPTGHQNSLSNSEPVRIGNHPTPGLNCFFKGAIDEPTIYNRALTSSEVSVLYNAYSGGKCPWPPTILVQPSDLTVSLGNAATFSVRASGSALRYQWAFNEVPIVGATNAVFTISSTDYLDAGNYTVAVSNSLGQVVSRAAVLTITPALCAPVPLGLVSWWSGETNGWDNFGGNAATLVSGFTFQTGKAGNAFSSTGANTGGQLGNPPNLELQNFTIETWIKRSSATSASSSSGGGLFLSYGYGGYGFGLNNDGSLFLTQVGLNNVTLSQGVSDTNFHHVAVTKSGSAVSFYIDGVRYPMPAYNPTFSFSTPAAIGARGDNLANSFFGIIDELAIYDHALGSDEIAAIYQASFAGKCALPQMPPTIYAPPTDQTVASGSTVKLQVGAVGSPPLNYQWVHDGQEIAGATSASLTLNNVAPANSGKYYVVVDNPYGGVWSADVTLAVKPPGLTNVWVEDSIPAGGVSNGDEEFSWVPYYVDNTCNFFWCDIVYPNSGSAMHMSDYFGEAEHQHYFEGATTRLTVNPGDTLFAYINIDPTFPPQEIMLQWRDTSGNWYRAFWGPANYIGWPATQAGALPPLYQWTRLEVPASWLGLEGVTLDGMAFTLYDGFAAWDSAGTFNSDDNDQDNISDTWQRQYFGPNYQSDPNALAEADPDGDGLTNLQEYRHGTDPKNADTDYDGRSDSQEIAEGTNPLDKTSKSAVYLGTWSFDSGNGQFFGGGSNAPPFSGDQGQAPIAAVNLSSVAGTNGGAVNINGTPPVRLAFHDVEPGGSANINNANGTVRFWVESGWNTGSGPSYQAPLFIVGSKTSTNGWSSLVVDSNGSMLRFITGTNGSGTTNLSASIAWTSSQWHQVALTYSATNSALYIDGTSVASGAGVTKLPNASERAQKGFNIGANSDSNQVANARFDEIKTFNYAQSPAEVSNRFALTSGGQQPNPCPLYPIALHVSVLSLGVVDISPNGPGNFGWLNWEGSSPSEQSLETSLTPPGDSYKYRWQHDHDVRVNDLVHGAPGKKCGVKDRIQDLIDGQVILTVPTWSQTPVGTGGNNYDYRVAGFARIRLTAFDCKKLHFVYLDNSHCNTEPPIADPQSVSTLEDQQVAITVTGHDPQGGPVTFAQGNLPQFGSLSGTLPNVTYEPNPNYFGPDNFTFTVSDIDGNPSAPATVSITVIPVNDPPTLDDIPDITVNPGSGSHNVPLTGISAGPLETQVLTVSAVSDHPAYVPNPTITYTSPNSSGTLTFIAQPSGVGTVIITVCVQDNGGTANGGIDKVCKTFRVIFTGNHPPTLTTVNVLQGYSENQAVPISYETLAANADEFDPDGDTIAFRIVSLTSGTLTKAGVPVTPGTTMLNPGESLTWLPPLNQSGAALNAFTIVANDGHGLESTPPVQVRVKVDVRNFPPVVKAGDDVYLPAPTVAQPTVQVNLPQGLPAGGHAVTDDARLQLNPTIWWSRIDGPVSGLVTFGTVAADGAVTATFDTPGDYVLKVTAYDGQFTVSDLVNVHVCATRDTALDVMVVLDVSGSMEEGSPPAIDSARLAVHGLLGDLEFTGGNPDAVGLAPFGQGLECGALPLLTDPNPINSSVDALGIAGNTLLHDSLEFAYRSLKEDLRSPSRTAQPVIVVLSDFELWDDLSGLIDGNPPGALATLVAACKTAGIRIVTIGFNLDKLDIDGNPISHRPIMLAIASSPGDAHEVTDPSQFGPILASIRRIECGTQGSVAAFGYASDRVVAQVGTATIPLVGRVVDLRTQGAGVPPLTYHWEVISPTLPDGDAVFSPNADVLSPNLLLKNPSDGLQYQLKFTTTFGALTRSDLTSLLGVSSLVNRTPVARCDRFTVKEDSVQNVLTVLINDTDPDGDALLIESTGTPNAPQHGSVTISGDRKTISYTPDANFNGSDSFSYLISDRAITDPQRLNSLETVRVTVTPVDDPPTPTPDVFAVDRLPPSSFLLNVLANDHDLDGETYTIVAVSPLERVGGGDPGSLQGFNPGDTYLIYNSSTDNGSDYEVRFTYTVKDPEGNTASAQVRILVDDNPNHPPSAVDDTTVAFVNTIRTIPVRDNDSDPDGDAFSIVSMTALSVPGDGAPNWQNYFENSGGVPLDPLVFHPKKLDGTGPGLIGNYIFSYTIRDSGTPPLEASAVLTIRLTQPGPLPVAVDDTGQGAINTTFPISVLLNDQGTSLTLVESTITTDQNGTAVRGTGADAGKFFYTPPNSSFYGLDSFTYTVADAGNRTATAHVLVTVYRPGLADPRAELTKRTVDPNLPDRLMEAGADPDVYDTSRDGVLELTGTADDPTYPQNGFYYKVTLYPLDSDLNQGAPRGTVTKTVRVPAATPAGRLGTFDLRGVPDGTYLVELKAFSGDQFATDTKRILVRSNFKVGNMRFSDKDLNIKVAGAPISLVRSYDSMRALGDSEGDFGMGWSYDLSDLQFEIDEIRESVTDDNGTDYLRRSGGGRDVMVTLPNGRKAVFAFAPRQGTGKLYAEWKCITPGLNATLTTDPASPDSTEYVETTFTHKWIRNGQTSVEKYDIPNYLLTTPDGAVWHIHRDFEGPHEYGEQSPDPEDIYVETYGKARVVQVDLPAGDHYYFSRNQVDHQAPGQTAKIAVLRLERDPDTKLIIAAHDRFSIDPATGNPLPNADPAVLYEYDDHVPKRLSHVRRLRDRPATPTPNLVYDTTTYEYYEGDHEFLVKSVIDPRGVRIAKSVYDDQGRLSRVEQPNGRWVEYHHDDQPSDVRAVARERTVDSEGRITINETDSRGNILLAIDPKGNRTLQIYDDYDNGLSEVTQSPDGTVIERTAKDINFYDGKPGLIKRRMTVRGDGGQNPARQTEEFEVHGRLTRMIDARNTKETDADPEPVNVPFATEYQYSGSGQPTLTVASYDDGDTQVSLSQNFYFESGPFIGMLHEAHDASGVKTVYAYYDGSPDPNDGLIKGQFGDVKTTTVINAAGIELSQTANEYDLDGNVTKEIRRRKTGGSWYDYAIKETKFDAQGREVEVIDAEGGRASTTYDSAGLAVSGKDRYGAETDYMYNEMGELIETDFEDGSLRRSVVYYADEDGLQLKHVVEEDRHFPGEPVVGIMTIYDELDQVKSTDRLKNIQIELIGTGQIKNTAYRGGVRVNEALGTIHDTINKYDAAGRIILASDPLGRWSKHDYDDNALEWRMSAFVNEDGTPAATSLITIFGYDENGNRTWVLDPNQYAAIKATLSSPDNPVIVRKEIVDNHFNRTTRFTFDEFNHKTRVDLPSYQATSAYSQFRYDTMGRRWLDIDPEGRATAFIYEAGGKLTWVITDVDPTTPGIPDPLPINWPVWAARGPDSTATQYVYDELGRLVTQVDAKQQNTLFQYDKLDRRTRRTLPDSSYETWEHDYGSPNPGPGVARINKMRHRDFNGRFTLWTYNSNGSVSSRLPDGVDPTVNPPPPTLPPTALRGVVFTYTGFGQRQTMTEGSGATERKTRYVYDEENRLWVKNCPEGTLTYTYQPLGNVTVVSARKGYVFPAVPPYTVDNVVPLGIYPNPSGAYTEYEYDDRTRLQHVYEAGHALVATYSYDESGNVKSLLCANQVTTTYEYNSRNQLRYLDARRSGNVLASFDYDNFDEVNGPVWTADRKLDRSGLRKGVAELIVYNTQEYRRLIAYDYDHLKRLQAERIRTSTGGPGTSWPVWPSSTLPPAPTSGDILYDVTAGYGDSSGYDPNGNRGSRKSLGVNIVTSSGTAPLQNALGLNYDQNDRLHFVASPPSYDRAGNAQYQAIYVSQNTPGLIASSSSNPDEYDFENHLIRRHNVSSEVTCIYDGDGHRVSKDVNGVRTMFLIDEINPTGVAQVIEERNAAGAPIATYIYGLQLCRQTRSGTSHYFGHDGHGNVRYLTSSAGVVTDTYTYDAFGILSTQLPASGQAVNHYLFAGEQWDPELGLYYLRARYYHPDIGRFWTMDEFEGTQAEPLSLHKYLYAQCNPVGNIDPLGSDIIDVDFGGAAKRGYPRWFYRIAKALGPATAYALWLGFSAHLSIGLDYIITHPGGGVYFNSSIKTILGLPNAPYKGKYRKRPDLVNNNTREVWEIKSGVLDFYLGRFKAIKDVDYYLGILNDPKINPGVRNYRAGNSYHPWVLSLAPFWIGYIWIDSDEDGALVYYFDTANMAALSAIAGLSIYSAIFAGNATALPNNIIYLPEALPDAAVVNF